MLERIYLDNVLTFVNFEWKPGPLAILLGENGAGKTGLFEAIAMLRRYVGFSHPRTRCFPAHRRTRWDSRPVQTFELDLRQGDAVFRYRLEIQHDPENEAEPITVLNESLLFNGQPVVQFQPGDLRLYTDQGGELLRTTSVPAGSALGLVQSSKSAQRLGLFKELLNSRMGRIRPNPLDMSAHLEPEQRLLETSLRNFGSWYLVHLSRTPGLVFKAQQALTDVLPGFAELSEQHGYLYAKFEAGKHTSSFRFDELSDGQRVLIALYYYRYLSMKPGASVFLDEPDNYVALREIQPWINEVVDLTLQKGGPQVMIISHNSEVINLLATDYGWRFFRDNGGPTRIERFTVAADSSLSAAETIARGWDEK